MGRRRATACAVTAALAVLTILAGCAPGSAQGCVPVSTPPRGPDSGALLGVNLDWGRTTLAAFSKQLGERPAVAVSFTGFPLTETGAANLQGAADQVRPSGALLLLTLEP